MKAYLTNIKVAVISLLKGLGITFRHMKKATHTVKNRNISDIAYFDDQEGLFSIQYPNESLPVPDNGRYRLHNEIDDCIVCDKCAKVCPVDCIEIEAIKDKEVYGHTSDGTPKRIHAARFDINMGKCCFCGLCTTVCPTECLTMTKAFDFSEFDIDDHTYSFANMSAADILAKQKETEVKDKGEAKKPNRAAKPVVKPTVKPKMGKPSFRPETKPKKDGQ